MHFVTSNVRNVIRPTQSWIAEQRTRRRLSVLVPFVSNVSRLFFQLRFIKEVFRMGTEVLSKSYRAAGRDRGA